MGNCMETCAPGKEEEREKTCGEEEWGLGNEGGMKVKILLTRRELEWLVLQLKEKGERRVEDVLMDLDKGREGTIAEGWKWKPALETIIESPEIQSFGDQDS